MKLWRELVIFYLGGMLYMALELAWRGWSHGSMFLLGGCCFWLIGHLDARHPRWPILLQMLCGTGKLYLQTGTHPGAMKDAVCSPGGTTIRGISALEKAGFRGAVIGAIDEIEGK